MSFCKKAVIFACLTAALFISCWKNDPAGPDNENGFEIMAGPTVTDADGNVYTSVVIGSQIWTVENWRSTKYNDSTEIPLVADSAVWAERTKPGFCYYDNATSEDTIQKWGALYNWYVVEPANPKKIAPEGWRVPTDAEWTELENYLIANGYNYDSTTSGNKIAKAMAAKTDWNASANTGAIGNDLSKNDASGFWAFPGGSYSNNGCFYDKNDGGYWWSATEHGVQFAHFRYLYVGGEFLFRDHYGKSCGFSVRLVRDLN